MAAAPELASGQARILSLLHSQVPKIIESEDLQILRMLVRLKGRAAR